MDTEFDIEIKEVLKDFIANGEVCIENALDYFEWIEKYFPIGHNRIDWEQVPHSRHTSIDPNLRADALGDFVEDILNVNPSLRTTKATVFGDDLIRNAYKMSLEMFLRFNEHFLSIPQHTYIVFDDTKQCMNYTFEDDLYFGTSPKEL